MSSPIVLFDGMTYTVSLFRPDATGTMKEEKHSFGEHSLSVGAYDRAGKRAWSWQIKGGPPADDGFFYYLYAQPYDVGAANFIWLQNKEEAIALHKAIKDAEELNDYRN